MREEIVVGGDDVEPLTEVKSTVIGSSILALRERGHEPRYLDALPADLRDVMPFLPAGTWVPLATAIAHYGACDALALPEAEVNAVGASVARLTRGTVVQMASTAAKGVATPWIAVVALNRLWGRLHKGSGLRVVKIGPKEGRLEVLRSPLARYGYWRAGLRAIVNETIAPFCSTLYVRELAAGVDMAAYRLSWV